VKDIKADKVVDKFFSVIYFTIIVIYGWIVLRETEYLPFTLGGNYQSHLSSGNIMSEFPVISSDYLDSMRLYYLVTLGYHFNSLRAVIW
jgi:hypothetical protein